MGRAPPQALEGDCTMRPWSFPSFPMKSPLFFILVSCLHGHDGFLFMDKYLSLYILGKQLLKNIENKFLSIIKFIFLS